MHIYSDFLRVLGEIQSQICYPVGAFVFISTASTPKNLTFSSVAEVGIEIRLSIPEGQLTKAEFWDNLIVKEQ